MQFTLVYQGDLPPKASAAEKWRIRRDLEPQVRRLWLTPPLNVIAKYTDPDYRPTDCYVGRRVDDPSIEYMPLITPKLDLRAELRILLLSAGLPGGLVRHGDIDNRLKTLFDALSVPSQPQEIPSSRDVEPDQRVFCLLDDDRYITRVDVESERHLWV